MVQHPQILLSAAKEKKLDSLRQDFRKQNDVYDHFHLCTFKILLTNGAQ